MRKGILRALFVFALTGKLGANCCEFMLLVHGCKQGGKQKSLPPYFAYLLV
jgi:hypothetical protein